jgi:hypothetical protein
LLLLPGGMILYPWTVAPVTADAFGVAAVGR